MNENLEKIIDNKIKTCSKKDYNVSEIEHNIDNFKNTPKTKTDFDQNLANFSLKSKTGNQIYYLKSKKPVKSENLNKKIIKKAKNNLGEDTKQKPSKKGKTKAKATKKKFTKTTKDKKQIAAPEKSKNSQEKDYNSLSNEVDNAIKEYPTEYIEIEKTKKLKRKNKKKLFGKKNEPIKPEDAVQKVEQKQDLSELKAKDFAQKNIIYLEIDKQSKTKSTPGSIPAKQSISEADAIEDEDRKLIDESLNQESINDKKTPEIIDKSDDKKSIFKRKGNIKAEDTDTPISSEIENKDSQLKHRGFKIDNLPEKRETGEEIDFFEKKLKETPKPKTDEEKNQTDKLAEDLVKDNIKSLPKTKNHNPFNKQKNSLEDDEVKIDIPLSEEKNQHEHVFFDENDSFDGWTPHITDKERKKLSLPTSIAPDSELESKPLTKDIELPKNVLNVNSVKLTDLGFSENEWEELEFYPLYEPFVYVEILREKDTLEKCYFLVEMDVTNEEKEHLKFIEQTMKKYAFDTEEMEIVGDDEYLSNSINNIINEYGLNVDEKSRQKILYYLRKSSLGLGKIDTLMRDPNIEDISCDGAGVPLFLYHRKYGSLKSNIKFNDEDELSSFIHRLSQKCGKHISIAEPMLDATMPDGSRIQMTLSDEITAKGSTFTIRKFKDDPFSPPDLFEYNTMSSEMIAYLWLVVENGINTLFAGGTASGKTTALNAVSLFIPAESKIVSIEETREINLPHTNWIPGVSRTGFGGVVVDDKVQGEIDMYDLMKAALRQRPEYILVGEIRGKEAYVLFQAMATGHATYSTVHADSAQSLIHRLEGKPINIPRVMLQSLDVICLHVTTKVKNNRARRCKQIVEIIDIDPTTKEILTNEVFHWDPVQDQFVYSGKSYVLEKIRAEKDFSREKMTNELKNRQNIIEWMNHNNIRQFKEVANIITRYAESPEEVLKEMKSAKNI